MMKISALGITKKFGSTLALDAVSLHFGNHVNLILGTNGSGKSTLINIIAGLTYPEEGKLILDGKTLDSLDIKAWRRGVEKCRPKMSCMLDKPGYPAYFNGEEFLQWATTAKDEAWTGNVAQRLDMTSFLSRAIGGYSSGMTQKIGLATSVSLRPELILWDEPTANLDAPTRNEVASLIRELAHEGTTFIIASHTPIDFDDVADWMCVMRLGRVLLSGMIEDLSAGSTVLEVVSTRPRELAAEALRSGLALKAEIRDSHVELMAKEHSGVEALQSLTRSFDGRLLSKTARRMSASELYAGAIAS